MIEGRGGMEERKEEGRRMRDEKRRGKGPVALGILYFGGEIHHCSICARTALLIISLEQF